MFRFGLSGSRVGRLTQMPTSNARLFSSSPVASQGARSVGDLSRADLEGKRVFVRADLNTPMTKDRGIADDTRIRSSVPTIELLLQNGAQVVLTSHLGRPKDGPEVTLYPPMVLWA